ncbi:MAG: hypothetical protein ABIJ09_17240 [Pseudomonadota bacterium]
MRTGSIILCCLVLNLSSNLALAQAEPGSTAPTGSGTPAAPVPHGGSPAEASAKKRLLLIDLEALAVDPATARIIDGLVTDAVHRHNDHIELLTTADMRQIVALESSKQNMGCSTETCLAELAGAMGARYVVFGQVGRLEELTLVQLNLFDSLDARSVGRKEIRTRSLSSLPDALQPAIDELLAPLLPAAVPTPAVAAAESSSVSTFTWVGGGLTAAGALLAFGLGGVALWMDGELARPASEVAPATKDGYLQGGPWLLAGTGVGGALAVAGLGLALFGLME